MSVDEDTVPDESGTPLEATFWALVILAGLAAFLFDFGNVLLSQVTPAFPAEIIHTFKRTMFLVALLGGGITVAIVAYIVFAHAAGRRDEPVFPEVGQGRFTLSLFTIGLVMLMVTTMFMGASTLAQTDEATPHEAAGQLDVARELHMKVTAGQWFWRFDVDGVPFTQGERVVLPASTLVEFEVTSADVIHSFAIQEVGIKKDAIPGQTNTAWFAVEEVDGETSIDAGGETIPADTYTVTCAELCGKGHSTMIATVYVVSPEDYETWVEANGGTVPESFHAEEEDGHGHG